MIFNGIPHTVQMVHYLPGIRPTSPKLDVMVHTSNPSTWEVAAEGSEVQGHLWLLSEFQASLRVP